MGCTRRIIGLFAVLIIVIPLGAWAITQVKHELNPTLTNTTPERESSNYTKLDDYTLLATKYPFLKVLLSKNKNISQSFPDAGYTVHVFAKIARERDLTDSELKILEITLKANECYFSKREPPEKSYYVISFSEKRPHEGIPYVECPNFTSRLPFVYYKGRGFQYYPVTATNWAYFYLKRGMNEDAEAILKEMLPLMEVEETNNLTVGLFKVYFSPPGESSYISWISSFSQGMLAGLYAWLYNETGNRSYLQAAQLIFNSFYMPAEEKGFVENTSYGLWFLEYPCKRDFLILNGHIITLKGLWLYYNFTEDERAEELFWKGVESVEKALPDCDTGSWSLYAVNGSPAREDYHRLHINLLVWLYAKTEREIFLEYAKKWNDYLREKGLEEEDIEALLRQTQN